MCEEEHIDEDIAGDHENIAIDDTGQTLHGFNTAGAMHIILKRSQTLVAQGGIHRRRRKRLRQKRTKRCILSILSLFRGRKLWHKDMYLLKLDYLLARRILIMSARLLIKNCSNLYCILHEALTNMNRSI